MNLFTEERKTVLVVDDEREIVRLVKNTLREDRYRVHTANSPAAALDLLSRLKGQLHLLITNLHMPKMNGVRLAERVTRDFPDAKVLFITGDPDHPVVQGLTKRNNMCLLLKPFTQAALLIKARTVLEAEPCTWPFAADTAD